MLKLVIHHRGDPEPLILTFDELDSVKIVSDVPTAPEPERTYRIEEVGEPESHHGLLVSCISHATAASDPARKGIVFFADQVEVF
jgi:hypothetical protein